MDDEIGVRVRLKERQKFSAEAKKVQKDLSNIKDEARGAGDEFDGLSKSTDENSKSQQRNRKETDRSTQAFRNLTVKASFLKNMLKLVTPAALIVGFGFLAQAASVLAAGAVALTSALAPAAGALVLYPAMAMSAATGLLAVKFAMSGVMDAVGKLNDKMDPEKFAKLSPAAQKFATVLDSMKPKILSLQKSVQRGLFPGLTAGLKAGMASGGGFSAIQNQLPKAGAAVGGVALNAGQMFGSSGFGKDLDKIMARNNQSITRVGRAFLSLVSALRHVMVAAGPFIGWVTKAIQKFALLTNRSAKAGRENGKLAKFFDSSRVAISRLVKIIGNLLVAFIGIGKAGKGTGNRLLVDIVKASRHFREWVQSASGQNKIKKWFADAEGPIREMGLLIRDIVKAFFSLGSGKGLSKLISDVRTKLLPILVKTVDATTKAFGPALIDAITSFAEAFAPLIGSSGPLTLFVKAFTKIMKGIKWLEDNIPGAKWLISTLFGAYAVAAAVGYATAIKKLIGATGALTVLKKAIWLVRSGLTKANIQLAIGRAMMIAGAVATWAITAAQWAWNTAMLANPIGLLVAAIIAGAVGMYFWVTNIEKVRNFLTSGPVGWLVTVLALLNPILWLITVITLAFPWLKDAGVAAWNWIREAAVNAWNWIRNAFTNTVNALVRGWNWVKTAAGDAARWVTNAWNNVIGFFSSLPGKIASAASGMFDGVKDAFRSAINWIIRAWNNFSLTIGGGSFLGQDLPSVTLNTPDIGELARGTNFWRGGPALVGEQGPELMNLPRGTSVLPAPQTAALAKGRTISAANWSSGSEGLPDQVIILKVDGSEMSKVVLRHGKDALARA